MIFRGLSIKIENPAGSIRSGIDRLTGKPWKTRMVYPYGEIIGTEGVDGDPVDVFIGPNKSAKFVYVVHQLDKTSGEFDEDKCFLGFDDVMDAKAAYYKNYDHPDHFYGSIEAIPLQVFKQNLKLNRGETMIHASVTVGDPVTVDGLRGRGVIVAEDGSDVVIRYRNGEYFRRKKYSVHNMGDNYYKSRYSTNRLKASKEESVEMEHGPITVPHGTNKRIVKVGTNFCVTSDGVDKNFGCYPSRAQAEAVLRGQSFIQPNLPTAMYATIGPTPQKPKHQIIKRMHPPAVPKLVKAKPMHAPHLPAPHVPHGSDVHHSFSNKLGQPLRSGGQGSGRKSMGEDDPSIQYEKREASPLEDYDRMRLLQESYKRDMPVVKVKAGGPGSGRHAYTNPYQENPDEKKLVTPKNDPTDIWLQEHKHTWQNPAKLQARKAKSKLKSYADFGEPMAGSMGHAHIEPETWFHPPSLEKRGKATHIPVDQPGEKDNKFLDVDKRKSRKTHEERMKLLKRSAPGGLPPQIPAQTTLLAPHQAVYQPGMGFAAMPFKKKRKGSSTLLDVVLPNTSLRVPHTASYLKVKATQDLDDRRMRRSYNSARI